MVIYSSILLCYAYVEVYLLDIWIVYLYNNVDAELAKFFEFHQLIPIFGSTMKPFFESKKILTSNYD